MAEQFSQYPELNTAGFKFEPSDAAYWPICLPIMLNPEKLVEEYPDYDEAFQPLRDACQKVEQHLEIFKKIAAELMEKYYRPEE